MQVLQVLEDLLLCKIYLSDEEISKMKKEKFKKIVQEKISQLSEQYLTTLVEKHSKSENLSHTEKIQNYLTNENTTVKQKKLLFLLRSRMYPVKMNFKQSYSDLLCSLCCKEEESQQHLLKCEEIVNDEEVRHMIKISYEDIFSSPTKQTEAVKVWSKIEEIRNKKLKAKEKQERSSQEDPRCTLGAS